MIPNIFHFILFKPGVGETKPFSLAYYLAVESAYQLNQPERIYLHSDFIPTGEWWDRIEHRITVVFTKAPEEFMGNKIYHVAHKADITRLRVLKEYGGAYLDMDTICVKPFKSLNHNKFVMAEEFVPRYTPKNWRQVIKFNVRKFVISRGEPRIQYQKICSAVLLSEKNSEFANLWLNSYQSFRSKGRDYYWNEHSGIMPLKILNENKDLATLLGIHAFHYPIYKDEQLKMLFEDVHEFPEAYTHHLWESFSWDKYLSKLTIEDIRTRDTTYNLIARKFI